MEGEWYSGEDAKVYVNLAAENFDMDVDTWKVDIYAEKKKLATFDRSSCARDDDGKYYIPLRAELLRPGDIYAVATVEIPDEDFESGVQRLVAKQKIGTYKKVA